jgi:hypothetical protein
VQHHAVHADLERPVRAGPQCDTQQAAEPLAKGTLEVRVCVRGRITFVG